MTRMSLSMSMASARYSSSSCRSNPATMLSMVLWILALAWSRFSPLTPASSNSA